MYDILQSSKYRSFRPLCHLNWAKVRTKATASEFASYNLCEDADISAQKYTLAYIPYLGLPTNGYLGESGLMLRKLPAARSVQTSPNPPTALHDDCL